MLKFAEPLVGPGHAGVQVHFNRGYLSLLEEVYRDRLYSPASIIAMCHDHTLFTDRDGASLKIAKKHARLTLHHLALVKGFPLDGDGRIKHWGRLERAWFGWRWASIVDDEGLCNGINRRWAR